MKPNIILVNCDDLGYGDLGCYGSPENRTPHLDQLAEEGIRFTDFYAMCPVCSASRAGMLTGTYPPRISFVDVLFPGAAKGMKPGENTIASLLKQQDYSTMIVGKWHCGDQKEFLPTEHGFDHYFGIPYSNDMGRQDRGDAARFWSQRYPDGIPPLPLLKDDEVIQEQPDQSAITERYVEKGVSFIRDNRDKPFFLYFPQMYVHLPIYVPENYLRNAGGDAYRAAVEHVDWSVGVLVDELRRQGLEENTLIVFTSDNGSRAMPPSGGSNAPLRGRKGQTWEGGQRVPCIMRWKGTIPEGRECASLVAAADFLPTFVNLAGGDIPESPTIDGVDLGCLLEGNTSATPRELFFYCRGNGIEAVRDERYKLHLRKGQEDILELYDLRTDISESNDIAAESPEIVAQLQQAIDDMRARIGDDKMSIEGSERRECGHVENAVPLTTYDENHPYIIAEYDIGHCG